MGENSARIQIRYRYIKHNVFRDNDYIEGNTFRQFVKPSPFLGLLIGVLMEKYLFKLRIYLLRTCDKLGYKIAIKQVLNIAKNIAYTKKGYCPFCHKTIFFSSSKTSKRESLICCFCHSFSRQRHVAKVLLSEYNCASLKELENKKLKIYSSSDKGSLDSYFRGNPNYTRSIYTNKPFGTEIGKNISCQDLQKLTFQVSVGDITRLPFQDETFDVVITEDVLEHVRNYEYAFKEINRVLKPGGKHIFTVPINLTMNMILRVDTSGEKDVFLLPPQYHGDPLNKNGILAYRQFGKDTPNILRKFGFQTTLIVSGEADKKLGIYDSVVLVSKKVENNL